jgi:hypothetical protein
LSEEQFSKKLTRVRDSGLGGGGTCDSTEKIDKSAIAAEIRSVPVFLFGIEIPACSGAGFFVF